MDKTSNFNRSIDFLMRWEIYLYQSKLSILLAAGILASLTWVLYGGALSTGYIADDFDLMNAITSPDFSIMDKFPAG